MHLRSHAAARGMTWGEHLKHAFKESPLSHLLDRPVLLCLHLLPLLHTPLVLGLPSWPSPILFCLPPYLSQSHWEITLHHLHCSFPFSPDNSPLLIPAVLSRWGPRFSIIKYRIPLSPPPHPPHSVVHIPAPWANPHISFDANLCFPPHLLLTGNHAFPACWTPIFSVITLPKSLLETSGVSHPTPLYRRWGGQPANTPLQALEKILHTPFPSSSLPFLHQAPSFWGAHVPTYYPRCALAPHSNIQGSTSQHPLCCQSEQDCIRHSLPSKHIFLGYWTFYPSPWTSRGQSTSTQNTLQQTPKRSPVPSVFIKKRMGYRWKSGKGKNPN